MRKKLWGAVLLVVSAQQILSQDNVAILHYIQTYKAVAIAEMKRTGVPAAITLAQGILETDAGNSVLVKKSNNHFGIKCKDDWRGETVRHTDDARNECFRKYNSALDSYRDHSDFLLSRTWYASLFQLHPEDYKGWAFGLKKAGYATNPKYPTLLIKLIEDFQLEQFTVMGLELSTTAENTNPLQTELGNDVITKDQKIVYPADEFYINNTKVIYALQGVSYFSIAQKHGIELAKLFEFNDRKRAEIVSEDQLIFLQRKRKIGEHETHIVQVDETLHSISQTEGIRLESLREYNLLKLNEAPPVGSVLYLRSQTLSDQNKHKASNN